MRVRISQLARVLLLVAMMSMQPAPTDQPTTSTSDDVVAKLHEQVRLRKLHLVRPDLIPYPISFEVYC